MDMMSWRVGATRLLSSILVVLSTLSVGEMVEAQWQCPPAACNAYGYAAQSFPRLSSFGQPGAAPANVSAMSFNGHCGTPNLPEQLAPSPGEGWPIPGSQPGDGMSPTHVLVPRFSQDGSAFNSCVSCGPPMAGTVCGTCQSNWAQGIYGGFEFLWMRAHFDQNVAMIIDPPTGNTLRPFDYGFELTPRTWLGWQSCRGGGFRATFWRYDEAAATERATAVPGATPVFLFVYGAGGNLSRNAYADPGETLVSNHSLRLSSLDLEATQNFSCFGLQGIAGYGLRLADMEQHLRGDIYDATNSLWEVVTNDLRFQGAGPTLSLQVQRPLCGSQFSLFGGLRGALLLCDTQQEIYEMKDGFANELTDVAQQTEILSMAELALGIQYSQPVGQRAQFFVRGSYDCQAWFDVGGPVDSHSTVALDGVGLATGLWF